MKNKVIVFLLFALFMANVCPAQSYYTGNGGAEIRLEVDTPELVNMSKDGWISDFVVNTVTDDIAKYSAIQIVDVRNIGTVTQARARDESATRNESQILEAGKFSVAQYILNTSITGKPSSFAISIRVNNKADLTTVAAYSDADVSRKNLESGKALKEATVELLTKMGVSLTADGKKQLLDLGTESVMTIEAQKNIARAEEARKNGSTIEAMSYYFKAAENDRNLQRALDGLQKPISVSLGNTEIEKIRMANKLRKEYEALLMQMIAHYKENPPVIIEYNPKLSDPSINYEEKTMVFSTLVRFKGKEEDLVFCNNLRSSFQRVRESNKWGTGVFHDLFRELFDLVDIERSRRHISATVELLDKNDKVIATEKAHSTSMDVVDGIIGKYADWIYFELPADTDIDVENLKVRVKY